MVAAAAVGSLAVDGGHRFSDARLHEGSEAELPHAPLVADRIADIATPDSDGN